MSDPNQIDPDRAARMADFDRYPLDVKRRFWETGGIEPDQATYERYIASGFDRRLMCGIRFDSEIARMFASKMPAPPPKKSLFDRLLRRLSG